MIHEHYQLKHHKLQVGLLLVGGGTGATTGATGGGSVMYKHY